MAQTAIGVRARSVCRTSLSAATGSAAASAERHATRWSGRTRIAPASPTSRCCRQAPVGSSNSPPAPIEYASIGIDSAAETSAAARLGVGEQLADRRPAAFRVVGGDADRLVEHRVLEEALQRLLGVAHRDRPALAVVGAQEALARATGDHGRELPGEVVRVLDG